MLPSTKLLFPRTAWVGPGCVKHLGEEAAILGRKALLVTGRRALREAGVTERLIRTLEAAGVAVEPFEEVPPEPDVDTVDRARARLRSAGCDLIVEAGGGSAIDVGKAAAGLALADAPTARYQQGLKAPNRGAPHIAIPTTAGTGAEATPNSVLIDPTQDLKQSVRGPGFLPDACIVDAELTLSCPPGVTAASGMDALAQAVEAFASIHATPFTDGLALEAAKLIAPNLQPAYERGDELAARAALAEGSFMAGVAMANARLGAVHGLAHPLGVLYNLPHGVVCAALLPPVLQRNAEAMGGKYARLREVMGADPVAMVRELLVILRLPEKLGPPPDARWEKRIMDYALTTGSSRANPVRVDEAYVRDVLDAVCT
jgi:alcohol dehydrogenase class IV